MISYYRVPSSKNGISTSQILHISQQSQLKESIFNKSILNIKILNMKNSNITDDTVSILKTISQPLQMLIINLSQNFSFITDISIKHLCQSAGLKNLKQLNMADNSITDEGLQLLSKCANMIKLQSLILYGNSDISSQGLIYLGQSSYLKNIKKLDIHDTSVCNKGLKSFFQSQNCSNLQILDLSMNDKKITDQTIQAMYNSKYLKGIKEIKCQDCFITDQGIGIMADSQNFVHLEVLNLNNSIKKKNNLITDESLHAIAYSKYIKKLKTLELRNTDITGKGINSLSMTLGSENLEILRISYCGGVRDEAGRWLQAIADYRSLGKLYINFTSISRDVAEKIGNKFPNLSVIY